MWNGMATHAKHEKRLHHRQLRVVDFDKTNGKKTWSLDLSRVRRHFQEKSDRQMSFKHLLNDIVMDGHTYGWTDRWTKKWHTTKNTHR